MKHRPKAGLLQSPLQIGDMRLRYLHIVDASQLQIDLRQSQLAPTLTDDPVKSTEYVPIPFKGHGPESLSGSHTERGDVMANGKHLLTTLSLLLTLGGATRCAGQELIEHLWSGFNDGYRSGGMTLQREKRGAGKFLKGGERNSGEKEFGSS